ncbi:MAG: hypothetical protein NW241_01640 [Bacteroidia bacterium]|nr:hypothetical protein [Bacteroidia bacterium]
MSFLRFTLLYTCLLTLMLAGWETARSQPLRMYFTRLEAGPSWMNFEALNEALTARQFLALPQSITAAGLTHTRLRDNWMLGLSMYNFAFSKSLANNQSAIMGYHYALVRGGYAFRLNEQLILYPGIGAGGGLGALRVRAASQQTPVPYRTAGPLVDLSINVSNVSPIPDGSDYGFEIGCSAGYLTHLSQGWQIEGFRTDSQFIPVSPQGFYVRVSMGLARYR